MNSMNEIRMSKLLSENRKDLINFEQLFYDLQPRLYAYCCKYVADGELARDIVQECFISLWENYENIETSYENYLFRAVHNRCLSHFRSERVHSEYAETIKMKIQAIEIHPELPYPLTELYLKEVNLLLQQSISQLPEKCRIIFMMSRYQGMKNQEIAEALGISVRTVDTHIYNALKILKVNLKDYLPLLLLFFPQISLN